MRGRPDFFKGIGTADGKMEIELNSLVRYYAGLSFKVVGVHHYTIKPDTVHNQMTAPVPGFLFPLSGKAQFKFNGTPYMVRQGNVVHGAPDMYLEKKVLSGEKWEFISVFYETYGKKQKELMPSDTHFELVTGQSPRLTDLLWRLWRTYNQPGAISAFRTEMLFRCVLEEVFVCANNRQSDGAFGLFERVSSYIHEHYMDVLSVRKLAELNDVNDNRLFYVFTKFSGMGVADYITEYRLNRAKELLITTDGPVGSVARSVGYPDQLYFSRIFRKRIGVSPSGLRELFRMNPCAFQDGSIPMKSAL